MSRPWANGFRTEVRRPLKLFISCPARLDRFLESFRTSLTGYSTGFTYTALQRIPLDAGRWCGMLLRELGGLFPRQSAHFADGGSTPGSVLGQLSRAPSFEEHIIGVRHALASPVLGNGLEKSKVGRDPHAPLPRIEQADVS